MKIMFQTFIQHLSCKIIPRIVLDLILSYIEPSKEIPFAHYSWKRGRVIPCD